MPFTSATLALFVLPGPVTVALLALLLASLTAITLVKCAGVAYVNSIGIRTRRASDETQPASAVVLTQME